MSYLNESSTVKKTVVLVTRLKFEELFLLLRINTQGEIVSFQELE